MKERNDLIIGESECLLVYLDPRGNPIGSTKISPCDVMTILKSNLTWRVLKQGNTIRAFATKWVNGRTETVNLPRFLLDPPTGLVVDHINRDPLDNRRENLRIVTARENNQNRGGRFAKQPN